MRIQELEKHFQEKKHEIKSTYLKFLRKLVLKGGISDKKAQSLYNKVDLESSVSEI